MTAKSESDKTEPLSARVQPGTDAVLSATVPPGFNKGQVLTKAIEVWASVPKDVRGDILIGKVSPDLVGKAVEAFLCLPEDLRKAILSGEIGPGFVQIVRKIVDERIAAGERAAVDLASRHTQKPGRKGRR